MTRPFQPRTFSWPLLARGAISRRRCRIYSQAAWASASEQRSSAAFAPDRGASPAASERPADAAPLDDQTQSQCDGRRPCVSGAASPVFGASTHAARLRPQFPKLQAPSSMNGECGCHAQQLLQDLQRIEQRLDAGSPTATDAPLQVPAKDKAAPPRTLAESFHRRVLPQECVAFSSAEGRRLFTEALNCGGDNYMQIYFPLAEQFMTQAEPAFCGLATLAMCLNALDIDPGRLWRWPWRWFTEEVFDGYTSLATAREKGITLAEFVCLARTTGAAADTFLAGPEASIEQFRAAVKRCCAASDEVLVLNYSRQALHQTGDGHFSPIGGYNAQRDMVLLLDVARFKYPPHWVRLSLVYEAMQLQDKATGLSRGFVVLSGRKLL